MSDATWPATYKQRRYGEFLESQLGEANSYWLRMSVKDASRRIDELVTLRRFREITNALSEATEAP